MDRDQGAATSRSPRPTSRRWRCTGSTRSPSSRSKTTARPAPFASRTCFPPKSASASARRTPRVAALPHGFVAPRGLAARSPRAGRREIEDVVADGERYRLFPPRPASLVDDDFLDLIGALEAEFERTRKRTKVAGKAGRAILVHVTTGSRLAAEESIDELEELAASSGLGVVDRIVQRRQQFDPRTLMGAGRLEDLIIRASRLQADYIVVDQNLTPAQARAIAESTAIKVIDRSQLILDIFARRARTHEGKIQVELAQLKYLLPRLMSHGDSGLSRLEGGIGGRGPGEQKLEVDRRRVRDRIKSLEKMLHGERTRREQRRARRSERDVPVVSIVGYTNAGKSTLLNVLTKSEVFVEQRMFATLDPSSRRLRLPREREIVINDTVGFIRDLPEGPARGVPRDARGDRGLRPARPPRRHGPPAPRSADQGGRGDPRGAGRRRYSAPARLQQGRPRRRGAPRRDPRGARRRHRDRGGEAGRTDGVVEGRGRSPSEEKRSQIGLARPSCKLRKSPYTSNPT